MRRGMGLLPMLDCTPPGGIGTPSTGCVDENLRRQQANMAEHDQGQRDLFIANCIRDYALNHGGSEAGNECDTYSFGSSSPYAQPDTSSAPARGGQVTFQNLTSGNSSILNVGDQWRVSISGASPNSQVSVSGGRNGQGGIISIEATDSSGNFSLTGTAGAGDVGSWRETWAVGSQQSGIITFTIVDNNADLAAQKAAAAKAQADATAKQATADPTNPAAQAAAEKAKADAAAAQKAAAQSQTQTPPDYSAFYWIGGLVVVGGLVYAAVNR